MFKPAILIFAALCAAPLCAATISIYAAADSQLDQAAPDTSWLADSAGTLGIINYMPGQERSDIFRFNLAALPSGATITGAKLWLYDTDWDDLNSYRLYWHPDSNWEYSTVTWNTFSTESNTLVGALGGSVGWQYNGWTIDLSTWDWAVDLTQGAATFQLREGYGNGVYNQNNFNSMLAPDQGVHPYLELDYRGNDGGPQVPEPATFGLLGAGLAAAAFIRVSRVRAGNGGIRS